MKSLISGTFLLFSVVARAEDIKILELEANEFWAGSYITQTFQINSGLERAWVEVSVSNDPEAFPDQYRTKVPGLRYDSSLKAIIFDDQGRDVTCARLIKQLGTKVIRPSGKCNFKHKIVKKYIDDGFERIETFQYQLFMKVK